MTENNNCDNNTEEVGDDVSISTECDELIEFMKELHKLRNSSKKTKQNIAEIEPLFPKPEDVDENNAEKSKFNKKKCKKSKTRISLMQQNLIRKKESDPEPLFKSKKISKHKTQIMLDRLCNPNVASKAASKNESKEHHDTNIKDRKLGYSKLVNEAIERFIEEAFPQNENEVYFITKQELEQAFVDLGVFQPPNLKVKNPKKKENHIENYPEIAKEAESWMFKENDYSDVKYNANEAKKAIKNAMFANTQSPFCSEVRSCINFAMVNGKNKKKNVITNQEIEYKQERYHETDEEVDKFYSEFLDRLFPDDVEEISESEFVDKFVELGIMEPNSQLSRYNWLPYDNWKLDETTYSSSSIKKDIKNSLTGKNLQDYERQMRIKILVARANGRFTKKPAKQEESSVPIKKIKITKAMLDSLSKPRPNQTDNYYKDVEKPKPLRPRDPFVMYPKKPEEIKGMSEHSKELFESSQYAGLSMEDREINLLEEKTKKIKRLEEEMYNVSFKYQKFAKLELTKEKEEEIRKKQEERKLRREKDMEEPSYRPIVNTKYEQYKNKMFNDTRKPAGWEKDIERRRRAYQKHLEEKEERERMMDFHQQVVHKPKMLASSSAVAGNVNALCD